MVQQEVTLNEVSISDIQEQDAIFSTPLSLIKLHDYCVQ